MLDANFIEVPTIKIYLILKSNIILINSYDFISDKEEVSPRKIDAYLLKLKSKSTIILFTIKILPEISNFFNNTLRREQCQSIIKFKCMIIIHLWRPEKNEFKLCTVCKLPCIKGCVLCIAYYSRA